MCIGIVSKCKRKLCKQRQDTKLTFIAPFCRVAIYGYILRAITVGNTLRLDSYGRDGSVLGVHSYCIDYYYNTDLIKWSYFAVGEACSLFKADDNSVDCVNVHDLRQLTSAVRKTFRLTCV